jgi:hypothetical protein
MTRYPLYRRLGRPQGWSGSVMKISPPLGFDPQTVQLVASHYTDYAIPAHNDCYTKTKYSLTNEGIVLVRHNIKSFINKFNASLMHSSQIYSATRFLVFLIPSKTQHRQ